MLESDDRIGERFRELSAEEIRECFLKDGGRVAIVGFINHRPGSEVERRDDGWVLEVRNARAAGSVANDVWLRPTNRQNSLKESEWVKEWLQSVGFDKLEAYVYYSSNIPHKRHIARDVGAVLKQLREHPELPVRVSHNYVGDAVHVVTTATELLSKLVLARMASVPESVLAAA